MPQWVEHAIWWHVYPLGAVGAEERALPDGAPVQHRLGRLEAWLDAPNGGVGGFMSQMLVGSLEAVWANYRRDAASEPRRPADTSGVVIEFGPRVTAEEANWAAGRIGKDGLRENEMALINFLKCQGAHLHPKLAPILDLAAA